MRMRKCRFIYYGLISLLPIAFVSCSQEEWGREVTGTSIDDTYTRSELIEYTIHVDTAGTLGPLIETGSYSDAQKLIVTGNIAYEDVNYVDVNMTAVEVLDLSGATYDSESIEGAFLSESSNIKEISLPGNITNIVYKKEFDTDSQSDHYYYPFKCIHLTSVTIPESVTNIGSYTFYGCSSLTYIRIPESVTKIGNHAFDGCKSLTNITIPERVTDIGWYAFSGCSSLTDITIPKSVTSIQDYAFYYCTSLTNIYIPDNVTSIGSGTFWHCESLTGITLPKGISSIEYSTFSECKSLTSIDIPEGVTNIEIDAFQGCKSLTNINLPKSVTNIGNYAFQNCSSLTTVTIPESVISIGEGAFYACRALQKLICNSSAADLGDLDKDNNLYCWLIVNRPDGNTPLYGPNWNNVVINGVAENVILPYHNTLDFIIPEEVTSIKKISYTMTFETNSSSSSYGIWRTIALPFKPTHITHAEKGLLAPFDSDTEGTKNFWLRELTTDGFKDRTQIEANHPYLIAMPYSKKYDDKYNISGNVTFSAENLTTEDFGNSGPLSSEGTDYTMYASYSYMNKTEGIYVLNSNNKFVNNCYSIYPFEAYLKSNTVTSRSVISLNEKEAATRASSENKRKPQIDDM
jgi:hypothetical protein